MVHFNKHCKILVSCSDKERNRIQAHGTSCKPLELNVSFCNCMHANGTAWQAHGTAYKLMEPLGKLMELFGKLMKLLASS